MSKIILSGYILVADSDLAAVKRELPVHIQLTQEEVGCLTFKVTQDESNVNQFHVYEVFVDRAAFELHQQRVSQSKWGLVSKQVERHYKISGN